MLNKKSESEIPPSLPFKETLAVEILIAGLSINEGTGAVNS